VGLSDLPPAPPLPASWPRRWHALIATADAEPRNRQVEEEVEAKRESAALEPAKKGSRWWLWALLLAHRRLFRAAPKLCGEALFGADAQFDAAVVDAARVAGGGARAANHVAGELRLTALRDHPRLVDG